jgi:hypothetical protein
MHSKGEHGSISSNTGKLSLSFKRILLILSFTLGLILALSERVGAIGMEAAIMSQTNLSGGIATSQNKAPQSIYMEGKESLAGERNGNANELGNDYLARKITEEIQGDPFIESGNIKVSVKNGVAILAGTVKTWTEYAAAMADAFQCGAREVRNQIEVIGETVIAGHRE